MAAKVWKLMKGRWGGITASGKRIKIVKSKEAAKKLVGLTSKSRSLGSKTKTSKKTTRRKRKLTKKRKRGSRKFTLPLAPIIGLAVGIVPAAQVALDGDYEGAINKLKWNYLGLSHDNKFKAEGLMEGLVPLIVGGLVHKFVGGPPLNMNRMLASANVPILRI